MPIEKITGDFALLEDWEDRYRYLIDLGRSLEPLADAERSPANKVEGCVSQVWLVFARTPGGALSLRGDSDAHIVRGLIAILLALYSGRNPAEIRPDEALGLFRKLGLGEHLTPQRSNGFQAMVRRIEQEALRRAA